MNGTLYMRGSGLGSVPRSYEDPRMRKPGAERTTPIPQHRRDDFNISFRPDALDTLEVLAECERHFTRAKRLDVRNGVTIPCPKADRCLAVRGLSV